ncbi:MAG TPA: imidazole glycerol phosphate synthase subunit HisH [Acidimicrobiia bacterium]|nr:imidazole glycerol phosphate synthase subunit HisH [Acidimicrobiia bacterium]
MERVAIVDYHLCNVDSVKRAFETLGAKAFITDVPSELAEADRIVLPGVGAFPDAMRNLHDRGLDDALAVNVLEEGAPFLGVCLGMQLLATIGHEVTESKGLGWFDASISRLVATEEDPRIPHVGWNEVSPVRDSPLFDGIPPQADFYFVHSFHMTCAHEADVLATTQYCGGFTSVVQREHVFGVQFHPEKSQQWGLRLLKNFLSV